jgi:1-acyl-sn-glycerol-3-phosphate acyltransferase
MVIDWSGFSASALLGGAIVGGLMTLLQRHPTRQRMWLPIGFALLLIAQIVGLTSAARWVVELLAGFGFAACLSLLRTQSALSGIAVVAGIATAFLTAFAYRGQSAGDFALIGLTAVLFVITLWLYRRPFGESLVDWPNRIMYRLRMVGPGVELAPRTGPLIVISNHPSYLDPCWIMICLPRDLTPLMYGEYFVMPGLHFYMKQIIGAIPAGATTFRREAPELDEVVRRLDRGEGVLIFPEGQVRRKEEPLRRFAQGAWRVLRDRPTTPVVACWIEGGWGSWPSFKDGPPFKGWPDFRRPIDIYASAPVVLDAETLADQHKMREVLRQMVLDAQQQLNPPPSPGFAGEG